LSTDRKVQVKLYGDLRALVGRQCVTLALAPGEETVRALLQALLEEFPALKTKLVVGQDDEETRRSVLVAAGGKILRLTDSALGEEIIKLLPPIVGG